MGITVNAGKIPVFQRIRQGSLKSREEKLERQQSRDRQIETLEKQKADLKNKECGSLEEIKDKLDLLHSYEDQITAVKQAFNNEQMHHILDEAREKGEKIAEEIKKFAPKTKEEREKELQEEALGIEEDQGMLSELMEELSEELMEEIEEELSEEVTEEIGEVSEGLPEREAEKLAEQHTIEMRKQAEEALAMHGKAGVGIDRYLDYYKRL